MVRQLDGSFLAAARASLEDVVAALGEEFDVGDAAEEVDTLGGYLFTKIGRVPTRGELVPGPGNFEIEVVDADPRRVKRLRIYRKKAPPAGPDRDGKRRPARPEAIHPPQEADGVPSAADAKVGEPSSPGASH